MIISTLSLLGGLVLLVIAADKFINGAVAIANKLNVAPILISLTIVSFGTSAPEFVVSLSSSLKGANGLILGNVVGSNIANTLLILGAAALIAPIAMPKSFYKDAWWLVGATFCLTIGVLLGEFSYQLGMIMVAMLFVFMFMSNKNSKQGNNDKDDDDDDETNSPWASKSWLFVIIATIASLSGIIYGADLLVNGAINIAQILGVSDEIIGLTVVAVGTSLPELATSCAAAQKGQSDMAIGNVVGSNIWNILFILGATSCINPIAVPLQIAQSDIWILLAATSAMIWFVKSNKKASKTEGAILLLAYAVYIAYVAINA